MDIEGMTGKIINGIEDKALLLSFVGTALVRGAEANQADPVGATINMLNPFQDPRNGGPLYELLASIGMTPTTYRQGLVASLKWKLLDAPHMSTQIGKMAFAVWAAGKVTGIVPSRYMQISEKVFKGAWAAALLMPGSGPDDPQGMNDRRYNQSNMSQINALKSVMVN